MTQTVFDNAMTAHVWASGAQPYGRSNNGNFYFEGPSLFSYGRHYCAGYRLPGGVFLINGDSSSMTTEGKHKNAARRAAGWGDYLTVPGLTETARLLDRLCYTYSPTRYREARDAGNLPLGLADSYMPQNRAERLKGIPDLARHMESDCGAFWPGAEAAAAIYRALGLSEAEAQRRAKAGEARVESAREKRKKAKAARKLKEAKREARGIAGLTPGQYARDVRHSLKKAAEAGSEWQRQRHVEEARENAREPFRAAKAAKAAGWPRVAAACRAQYQAARAEIARYERQTERYADRAALRTAIESVRTAEAQFAKGLERNPLAELGTLPPRDSLREAVRQSETMAAAHGQLAAFLGQLAASRYALAVWGPGELGACYKAAQTARDMQARYADRAGGIRLEWQAEARREWRENGTRPPYELGQLKDSKGGALLRAEAVTRDPESGQINGGQLVTSWGASVPLPHAIRAFRFLKLCREKGMTDSTFERWESNGHTIRVGHFRVDWVDREGNFKAGCHAINWPECARLAESLGLSELASDDSALSPSRAVA